MIPMRNLRILACALIMTGAWACGKSGSGTASNSSNSGGSMKIAVIPKGTTHVFWRTVEAGAKQAGKDLNVTIQWQGPLKEDDRGQQIGLVEQFISNGVNGIVLAPLDATALQEPVSSAMAKKIPVVIFDSALNGEVGKDFVSLVATDNKKGGEIGGAALARLHGGTGQ